MKGNAESPAISSALNQRVQIVGRIFFAVGVVGIGIQHFIFSNFIPVIVPWWPDGLPGRPIAAYLVGSVLVFCGGCILLNRNARFASTSIGLFFLSLFVFLQIPLNAVLNPYHIGAWTVAIKEFAFFGCAFVVANALPPATNDTGPGTTFIGKLNDRFLRFAPYPLAILVAAFGTDHFLYTEYVETLVPSWIPDHVFWTYFAGAALIAAGIGIILNVVGRLAATMLGAMLFVWVVILHIPRAIADPAGQFGNEWTSVFEALAFSGAALIIGQMLPKRAPETDGPSPQTSPDPTRS